MHSHVLLANLLTQSLLNSAHAALPALTNLLSTGEGLAVEVEALLNQLVDMNGARERRTVHTAHSFQLISGMEVNSFAAPSKKDG